MLVSSMWMCPVQRNPWCHPQFGSKIIVTPPFQRQHNYTIQSANAGAFVEMFSALQSVTTPDQSFETFMDNFIPLLNPYCLSQMPKVGNGKMMPVFWYDIQSVVRTRGYIYKFAFVVAGFPACFNLVLMCVLMSFPLKTDMHSLHRVNWRTTSEMHW